MNVGIGRVDKKVKKGQIWKGTLISFAVILVGGTLYTLSAEPLLFRITGTIAFLITAAAIMFETVRQALPKEDDAEAPPTL